MAGEGNAAAGLEDPIVEVYHLAANEKEIMFGIKWEKEKDL